MTLYELTNDDALAAAREEGWEEGKAKKAAEMLDLINAGYSLEDLKLRLMTENAAGYHRREDPL